MLSPKFAFLAHNTLLSSSHIHNCLFDIMRRRQRHLKFNIYEDASLPLTLLPVFPTVQQPPPPYTPILMAENVGISLATTLSLVSHNNVYCDSTSKQLPRSLLSTPYLLLDIFLTGTLSSTLALPLFALFKT